MLEVGRSTDPADSVDVWWVLRLPRSLHCVPRTAWHSGRDDRVGHGQPEGGLWWTSLKAGHYKSSAGFLAAITACFGSVEQKPQEGGASSAPTKSPAQRH